MIIVAMILTFIAGVFMTYSVVYGFILEEYVTATWFAKFGAIVAAVALLLIILVHLTS